MSGDAFLLHRYQSMITRFGTDVAIIGRATDLAKDYKYVANASYNDDFPVLHW